MYFSRPVTNRTASKLLGSEWNGTRLHDANLLPILGQIGLGARAAAISDDGGRVFSIDYDGKVHVWDTSAPRLDDSQYPELGTAGGTAPPVAPGNEVHMALSVDERTLYLVGESALVVLPVP